MLTRETALIVPQANSRPVKCPQDIGDYSGIARRSESKENIPIMQPRFDSIHIPLFRLMSTVFSYTSSCGTLGVSSLSPKHYHSRDTVVGKATRYGLDGPRFDPGAHASFCRMGTGFIIGGKARRGVVSTAHLAPRLFMVTAIPLFSPLCFQ